MLGNLRADVPLAGKYQANGLDHLGQARALGQVARRPCLQQAGGKRVFLAHRDHHNLDVGVAAQQLGRGAKTADPGHLDVHQHHIGFQLPGLDQGLLTRFGLADYLQAIDVSQHSCYGLIGC